MGGERTYCLRLAYDGTRYCGWQRLPGTDKSIQGRIEAALTELFGQPVTVDGSGRTDAGVHASGQVASFRAPEKPCAAALKRLRQLLPQDIGALSLDYAPDRFHARLCAREKTYVYRIWNSEAPDVFARRWRVQLARALDLDAMRQAAAALCGTHDFSSFCANPRVKKSTVRTLRQLEMIRDGEEVQLRFTADGFLYHMVRILVGTLLEFGEGKREAASMPELLAARTRALAGETAPAKGLCLTEVRYD